MRTPSKYQVWIRWLHTINRQLWEMEQFEWIDLDNWELSDRQAERFIILWEIIRKKLDDILSLKN